MSKQAEEPPGFARQTVPPPVDSYASTETRVQPGQPDGYYSRPWLDVDHIIGALGPGNPREPSVKKSESSAENIGAGVWSFSSNPVRVP